MSTDIITRLRAALDADEAAAQAIARNYGDTWTVRDDDWVSGSNGADVIAEPHAPAAHIATYDPARALADIAAKRAILDLHRPIRQRSTGSGGGTIEDCAICDAYPAQYPCTTVRLLAEAYGITEDGPAPQGTALGHDWRDAPGRSRHYRHCNRCGVRDVETTSTICPGAPAAPSPTGSCAVTLP